MRQKATTARRFLTALALLAAPLLTAAPPALLPLFPERAPLTGIDDQLYPLGWSADGNLLAVLIEHFNEAADDQRWELLIQDLRTDKAVHTSQFEVPHDTSLASFWTKHGNAVAGALTTHKIARADVPLHQFPGLLGRLRGTTLETSLTVVRGKEANFGYTGVKSAELRLTEDATKTKTVFKKSWKEFYPLAVGVSGYLESPSGERIAILLGVTRRGWEGPPHARSVIIVGAGVDGLF